MRFSFGSLPVVTGQRGRPGVFISEGNSKSSTASRGELSKCDPSKLEARNDSGLRYAESGLLIVDSGNGCGGGGPMYWTA